MRCDRPAHYRTYLVTLPAHHTLIQSARPLLPGGALPLLHCPPYLAGPDRLGWRRGGAGRAGGAGGARGDAVTVTAKLPQRKYQLSPVSVLCGTALLRPRLAVLALHRTVVPRQDGVYRVDTGPGPRPAATGLELNTPRCRHAAPRAVLCCPVLRAR